MATHLARVYLLAAEGIVVGTHFGGGDAVPVLVLSVSSSIAILRKLVVALCVGE